jgi:hypothetical protein
MRTGVLPRTLLHIFLTRGYGALVYQLAASILGLRFETEVSHFHIYQITFLPFNK